MEAPNTYRKGLWTEEEDRILMDYIRTHGKGKWNQVARVTGLKRCGKSCRLRWINYLSPSVKRGDFSEEEEDLIIRLHKLLGNRWSLIAGRVPGRTDNQVKNHWNTHLSKKLGIKKGRFKSSGSSKPCSTEMDHKSAGVTSPDGNSGPPAPEDSSKGTVGFGSSLDLTTMTMSGFNESSFWLSNDDFNLYTPGFMELLDGYSLDFQ